EFPNLMWAIAMKGRHINVTLNIVHDFGSKDEKGQPIGCYRSLYANESDVAFVPIDYPTDSDHFDRVFPYIIMWEENEVIISPYNRTYEKDNELADILATSLKSFQLSLWILILITLVIFALLLYIFPVWDNWLRKTNCYSADRE